MVIQKVNFHESFGKVMDCMSGQDRTIHKMETVIGLLVTLLLVVVHFKVMMYAGPLWRDEINTVNLAMEPSFSKIWAMKEYDSFPLLWVAVLRGWVNVGLGDTDLALRSLGLIIGLGILLAIWLNARWLGYGVPLLSLLFFGFSSTVFRFGDSMRAYGCGALLLLLAMGAIWRLVQKPTIPRTILAGVASIFSVQCLYQNLVLLFAVCAGGVAVAIRRRAWKTAFITTGIWVVSASLLLPYIGSMHRLRSWNVLLKYPIGLEWIFNKFSQAIGGSGTFIVWLWFVLMGCAIMVGIHRGFQRVPDSGEQQADKALFMGVGLIVGTVAYVAFLMVLGYQTEPWYYISVMALLAVSFDVAIYLLVSSSSTLRLIRLVFVVVVAIAISNGVWAAAGIRQTNIDLICSRLEAMASRDDLIVVNPWMLGITFDRYYKGSTPWSTLPDIQDHKVHRYDLFKEKMMDSEPITPLLSRISQTLHGGHRVWLVGGLHFFFPGDSPGNLPLAPRATSGWLASPYYLVWSQQAAYWVMRQTQGYTIVPVPVPGPVNPYENQILVMVERQNR